MVIGSEAVVIGCEDEACALHWAFGLNDCTGTCYCSICMLVGRCTVDTEHDEGSSSVCTSELLVLDVGLDRVLVGWMC